MGRVFGWAGLGLFFVCLFALIFGLLVKWLWNMLMPAIFGLGTITFWQAFALIILAKLLFGSFGGPRRSYRRSWHTWNHPRDWHHSWNRTSEKKEPMRDRFRDWKSYHQFWEDEGKEAFRAYVDKKKQENKDHRTPDDRFTDNSDNSMT